MHAIPKRKKVIHAIMCGRTMIIGDGFESYVFINLFHGFKQRSKRPSL